MTAKSAKLSMTTQVELIKKYGLTIRGHSGQHLLLDPNMQRKVVDLLDPQANEQILEIGPGLGALTGEILRRGAKLWGVEKDNRFVSILEQEYKDFISSKQLTIFAEDFLEFDFQEVRDLKKKKIRVIGNLPYYITAPILFHLMDHRPLISEAVLTIQKEVADRLIASPGSKNYGRLTLALRYVANVMHHFDIPPACFTPKPEVFSSVISVKFHTLPSPLNADEEKWLFHTIQMAFSQRRKTLVHLMSHHSKLKIKREEAARLLASLNFPAAARGEELLLKDYMVLTQALKPIFERAL